MATWWGERDEKKLLDKNKGCMVEKLLCEEMKWGDNIMRELFIYWGGKVMKKVYIVRNKHD